MTGFKRLLNQFPDLPLAACKHIQDKDLFFPSDHQIDERLEELRTICGSCPEVAKCLRYALEANESTGFWGGKTAKERRAIKRRHPKPNKRSSTFKERGSQILEFRERGATYKEIAEQLGISEGSAVQIAVRYRKKLKKAM